MVTGNEIRCCRMTIGSAADSTDQETSFRRIVSLQWRQ